MRSQSLISRTCLFSFLLLIPSVHAQSIPGATFYNGTGAPTAGQYQLVDDYEATTFFNKFNFYSSYDPTYGHVQYVDETVAVRNGFVKTSDHNTALISVDTTNKWPNGGPGRPSVRLISDNTYTHGLFILDLIHMPFGCGTWPAYWLLGPNWPSHGEIDIIEGVNYIAENSITMHTTAGCSIAGSGQTAVFTNADCESDNGGNGCGSQLNSSITPNNYGDSLNSIGGGVYATEWTSNYVKTWFFPRGQIPASITNGAPDVTQFGIPAVNAQGNCQIDQHFGNMSIIINTDFCGAWAGQAYEYGYPNCPQNTSYNPPNSLDSCVDFVGNNPSNFSDAYWEINSMKVYQMPPGAQPSVSYSTSLSSVSPFGTTNTLNMGMGASTTGIFSSPYTGPLSSATITTSSSASSASPAICPAANDTIWTDNNGQLYNIACGSDYQGGSTFIQTQSFEACLESCDNFNGCTAVSFTGGNFAGDCYLKTAPQHSLVYNGATNAAIRVAGAASVASSSGYLTTFSTTSNASYVSVSSTPHTSGPSSPSVALMTTTSTSTTATTASSSPPALCPSANGTTYTDPSGAQYMILCDSDMNPASYSASSQPDFTSCISSCSAQQTACVAATWLTGTCYYKSSYSMTVTSETTKGHDAAVLLSAYSPQMSSLSISASMAPPQSSGVVGSSSSSIIGFTTTSSTTSSSKAALSSAASVQCPAQNGTTYSDSTGNQYMLLCDIDTDPGSYGSSNQPDFASCIDSCSAQISPLCVSVTFFGSQCYYKSSFSGDTMGPGTVGRYSAVILAVLFPMTTTTTITTTIISTSSSVAVSSSGISSFHSSSVSVSSPVNIASSTVPSGVTSLFTTQPGTSSVASSVGLGSTSSSGPALSNTVTQLTPNGGSSSGITTVNAPSMTATTLGAGTGSSSSTPLASASSTLISSTVISWPASLSLTMSSTSSSTVAISATSTRSSESIYGSASSASLLSQSGIEYGFASTTMTGTSQISTEITTEASSARTGWTSSSSAAASAAPSCPDTAESICGGSSQSSTCTDSNGATYGVSCGEVYQGTVLNPAPGKQKRQTAESSFQACQALCDDINGCVALNYIGAECTIFSSVTGSSMVPGAISASQISPPSNAPSGYNSPSTSASAFIQTNAPPGYASPSLSASSPGQSPLICPQSAGSFYTDSKGTIYGIGCYTDYAGNTIGSPINEPSVEACLPYCDSMNGCVGVEYNVAYSLCYLKSSFSGIQTSNTSVIYGMKGRSAPGMATVNAATVTPSMYSTMSLASGATVTVVPIQTVTSTVPPGGYYTTGSSGAYYVYTTVASFSNSGNVSSYTGPASLCYTCALTPTVVTGGTSPGQTIGMGPIVSSSYGGTCGPLGAVGTTTIFTTQTVTSCGVPLTCPASGYVLGSGTRSGAMVVTTTNQSGQTITYTQIPTGSGNGGSGEGGSGSGGSSGYGGPGTGGSGTGGGTAGSGGSGGSGTGGGGSGSGGSGTGGSGNGGSGSGGSGNGVSGNGGGSGSGGSGTGGPGGGGSGSGGSGATQTLTVSGSTITTTGSTTLPTCPYTQGELFTDSMGMQYYILCNTRFTDATLDTQTQPSLPYCIAACDMYNTMTFYTASQCLGVSWDSTQESNNCQLKAGKTGVYQDGVHSAFLTTPYLGPGTNGTGGGTGGIGGGGGSGLTTVVGTMTSPPQVITVVTGGSTIVTGGLTIVTGGITSVIGGSTFISTVVGGSDGPGGYGGGASGGGGTGGTGAYGGGGGGGGSGATVTVSGGNGGSAGTGATSYIPSTIYGTATEVSTYVSNGITMFSTYGVSTAISVVYYPATTKTVTTTIVSISISISNQISTVTATEAGPTVTASAQLVTITEGGGNQITVTAPPSVIVSYVYPKSSSSSFTCRTYATNYLNGQHGKVKRDRKRSIFDTDQVLGEMERMPMPGSRPEP